MGTTPFPVDRTLLESPTVAVVLFAADKSRLAAGWYRWTCTFPTELNGKPTRHMDAKPAAYILHG